jgi:Zinc finger, C3HC4 type (RING finger)
VEEKQFCGISAFPLLSFRCILEWTNIAQTKTLFFCKHKFDMNSPVQIHLVVRIRGHTTSVDANVVRMHTSFDANNDEIEWLDEPLFPPDDIMDAESWMEWMLSLQNKKERRTKERITKKLRQMPTSCDHDKETCVICMENNTQAGSSSCSHRFCADCLIKVVENSRLCPLCRGEIEEVVCHV